MFPANRMVLFSRFLANLPTLIALLLVLLSNILFLFLIRSLTGFLRTLSASSVLWHNILL